METTKDVNSRKKRIHDIIFYTDTRAGKAFDVVLLIAILLSILAVMLESVPTLKVEYRAVFYWFEVFITALFTLEYILRIYVSEKPKKYIFSLMGMIDLISIIPAFLAPFIRGTQYLTIIRTIRLIRVFRILKLTRFLTGLHDLSSALKASRYKIIVFLSFIMIIVIIMGTLLYIIEGPEHGFESIPHSVYWAIVTITTVGYGDISPQTPAGQFLASLIMIIGYGVIAVPTGIVSSEFTWAKNQQSKPRIRCGICGEADHKPDAKYCHKCGNELRE